jgi:hypothetical protein
MTPGGGSSSCSMVIGSKRLAGFEAAPRPRKAAAGFPLGLQPGSRPSSIEGSSAAIPPLYMRR